MTRDRSYIPIDLSAWCRASIDVFDTSNQTSGGTWLTPEQPDVPPVGACSLRGIPFQVGPVEAGADVPRFLSFLSDGAPAVEIPIGRSAHNIVFAHSILRTGMWTEGTHPGRPMARYIFETASGAEHVTTIRERFEIGHFPQPWGHSPFLALPDTHGRTEPRFEGAWHRVGYRLTEVDGPTIHAYHLWAWRNPAPEVPIVAVRIEPLAAGFVVAGITVGQVDEDPLRLPPRQPVILSGFDDAESESIELAVDRGIATYVHPTMPDLPQGDSHDTPGWGRSGSRSRFSYVAATPSATVRVQSDAGEVGSFVWADAQDTPVSVGTGKLEVVQPDRNWVHVTVSDERGNVVPCRVAFASESGIPYPPHGHHSPVHSGLRPWNLDVGGDVHLGDVSYAYIDGRCQGWLPRGRVAVEIARGFEYTPVSTYVDIAPGQRNLDLTVERWIDMNDEGWYSGDTHVHFLSPNGALTEAAGEGLNVVNLLQAQWGHLFTNIEDFTGQSREASDGHTIVHVSQENRQHVLGHLNLLGLRRPVYPLSSDGASEAELGGGLDTTTSRWADAAHEQGATVIVAHMPTPNGETAVLVSTGRADGLEMIDFNTFEHMEYYRYLNGGYKVPLVAGTDKMEATIPVGEYRTYARLDGEFTFDRWLSSVRAGRTFATSGPMLRFSVDGEEPGASLKRPTGARVSVKARAESIFPIHTLQIVQGGEVVAEESSADGTRLLELEAEVTVSSHGWMVARCAGPGYTVGTRHQDHDRRAVMAHTSPVYLETGERHPSQLDTARYLMTLVEGGLGYVRSSLHHPPGSITYAHGELDHQAYLVKPFLEAQAALAAQIKEWEPS